MIPFASCMCFQGKGALWTSTPGKRPTNVEVVETDDHKICIRVTEKPDIPDAGAKKRPATLSKSEWCLLRALEHSPSPWRPTASFQTPQRRRCRARIPIIRSQALRSALLDDSYQGITQSLLEGCGRWPFNTFHLDVSTGGRSLSILMVHLFQQYGFLEHFGLDPVKVWRCFNLFESCYHSSNPYHNSVHAADVTQAMHCFLQEKKISSCITPVEAISALLAAVTHDLDHPGVNQPFLIATSNHLATLYKNFSVLENHHWRMAISCLREARLFDHLDKETWDEIENNIHSLILATDITRQQEFLAKFKRYLENDALDLREAHHRHFILQIALKCADLCNPCRPWAISQNWSQQVCLEFYKQGEFEKSLNLPVTPICDRTRSTIAKIQADFFRFVVTPLFDVWHGFLSSDLSVQLISNLHHNQQCWERKANKAAEAATAKKRTSAVVTPVQQECSPADIDDNSDDCMLQEGLPATLPSFSDEDSLSLTPWCQRRCSMPLSIPKLLPRTTLRRQSFPHTASPISDAYPIHRSPHVSLRTLSAEQLQPKTSIVSLSSSGALSLHGLISLDNHPSKRLVHQPSSYPPFSYSRSIMEPSELEESGSEDCLAEGCCEKSSTDGCCKVDSLVGAEEGQSSNAQSADTHGQSIVSPLNEDLLDSVNRDLGSTNMDTLASSVLTKDVSEQCSSSVDVTTAPVCEANLKTCDREKVVNVVKDCSPRTSYLQSGEISGERLSNYSSNSGGGNGRQELLWCPPFGFAAEVENCKEFPLTQSLTTWCSQISRSLSEERPEPPSRGFDSPAPSWKSSSSSISSCNGSGLSKLMQRRGSAPVSTGGATPCPLLGGTLEPPNTSDLFPFNYGRRWSLAADSVAVYPDCREVEVTSSHHPLCRELARRHSFGILEPFAGVPSSESENDGSSTEPTSTGTTCSTRRSSTVVNIHASRVHNTEIYDPASDIEAGSCSSESHDMFPTCLQPPRHIISRRRGSLPADIPISLVTRISTYTTSVTPIPGSTDSIVKADIMSSAPWRRSSAGEVLGALIGHSSSTLAHTARQFAPPAAASFSGIRRGSGGLELEGGLWHSSAGVFSSWQNVCGVSKTARTLCKSDSGASEDFCLVRRHLVGLSSGISGVSSQRLWRGSAPFDLSLLSSASSGNFASGGLED